MSVQGEPSTGSSFGSQVRRVRAYWWLVAAVANVCCLVALWSWATAEPAYTGRSSLVVSSSNRAPDQDAVLVTGLAQYLNSPTYQQDLLSDGVLAPGGTVLATTAAGSPILLVDVTAGSADAAQTSATAVAQRFSDDMNRVYEKRQQALIDQFQRDLDAELAKASDGLPGNPSEAVVADLRDQIDQLKVENSNRLEPLQLDGGVTEASPSLVRNLGLALVGGLVGGVLLALAVGRLSGRIHSREDVEERLGLTVLGQFPGPSHSGSGLPSSRGLATVVASGLPRPAAVAVNGPTDGRSAELVAEQLASEWARQGHTVVAVLPETTQVGGPSEFEWSDAHGAVDLLKALDKLDGTTRRGPVDGLWVLTPRSSADDGLSALGTQAVGVLTEPSSCADYVVLTASPVGDLSDGDGICAAAGSTLLVVNPATDRVGALARNVERLGRIGSRVLGAVLVVGADATVERPARRGRSSDGS